MGVMAKEPENVLRLTPRVEELLPNYVDFIQCREANCKSSFRNRGNYYLHMVQHHRKPPVSKRPTVYHCPVEKCIYHIAQLSKRCCSNLSLIRQHYRKVHLPKEFVCEDCNKAFVQETELQKHQTDGTCGYVWKCDECDWKYGSREALLTHTKRKGHKSRNAIVLTAKKTDSTAKLPQKRSANVAAEETLDEAPKRQCDEFSTNSSTMITVEAPQHTAHIIRDLPELDIDSQTEMLAPQSNTENHMQQELYNDIDIDVLLSSLETSTDQLDASACKTRDEVLKELDLEQTETSDEGTTTVAKKLNDGSTFLISWPTIMDEDLRVSTATQTSCKQQLLLNTEVGLTRTAAETQTEPQTQTEYTTAETQTRETPYLILSDVMLEPSAEPMPECATVEPPAHTVEPPSDVVLGLSAADVLVNSETQTSHSQCLLNPELSLVDMETQTNFDFSEPAHGSEDNPTATVNQSVSNCLRLDDFLVSTETQTSYEQCLLNTNLTLADIETQTNWSYNEPEQGEVFNDNDTPASMLEATKACGVLTMSCQDYLVSTETQTNFAQNLRLNTNDTNSNDGLYTTQYTQTGDELLNELWFGEQENFQSVYTQT